MSFSCQVEFQSKLNIERQNSSIYETKNKKTKKRKKIKKLSNHRLIWDLQHFHIITFPRKNIYEGVPFIKSADMQLATNDWVIKNDRRLDSKLLLRSISLV